MKMTVKVWTMAMAVTAFTGLSLAQDASATSSSRPPKNLKLVGDHWTPWDPPPAADGAYIIQRGDNFWDLSGKWLGDPYLWPQVWDQNRYVLDSHWIYPGDPLNIPARPQVVPPEGPAAAEGESAPAPADTETAAAPTTPTPAPRSAPSTPAMIQLADEHDLYCSGSIADEHEPSTLRVAGAELEKDMQADEDILYLNQGRAQGIQAGAEYLVVRPEHEAIHPATREALGTYVQRMGRIRVLCTQEETSIAVVIDACNDLMPGDELLPWRQLEAPMLERVPPVDRCQEPSGLAQGYVVDGGAYQPTVFAQGHVVHADLGEDEGVRPGSILTVYRDNGDHPRIVVGEAVVLTVDGSTSTIKLIQSTREARWGDRVEILQQ